MQVICCVTSGAQPICRGPRGRICPIVCKFSAHPKRRRSRALMSVGRSVACRHRRAPHQFARPGARLSAGKSASSSPPPPTLRSLLVGVCFGPPTLTELARSFNFTKISAKISAEFIQSDRWRHQPAMIHGEPRLAAGWQKSIRQTTGCCLSSPFHPAHPLAVEVVVLVFSLSQAVAEAEAEAPPPTTGRERALTYLLPPPPEHLVILPFD